MSALKKLMKVRIALQGNKIKGSGRNTFAKYDYLQLDDFLPVAQALCDQHGLCGVCSFTADLATLTLTDLDDETSRVVITSPMGSADLKGCHEVQNVGAVETYQRRYLWVAALELVEHDALDSAPPREKAARPAPEKALTNTITLAEGAVLDWIASIESQASKKDVADTLGKAKTACEDVGDSVAYARIVKAAKAHAAGLES